MTMPEVSPCGHLILTGGKCLLSPFLLLHHINSGLTLACTTLLVYSPFAQRALVLMGAGEDRRPAAETAK